MPDSKISALPSASALTGTEQLAGVQSAASVAITANQLKAFSGPQSNFAATGAPTVTDDSAAGYAVGSRWLWVATGQTWTLRDSTVGAARWESMDTADHPGYVSGNWYHMVQGVNLAAGAALATNTLRIIPVSFKSRVSVNSLGVRITTLAAAGNIQLALYANNMTTGRPTGTALATTGSISTTLTGPVSATLSAGNTFFEPGIYWLAVNSDNSTVVCQAIATSQVAMGWVIGSATQANITNAATTGALALSVATQTFGTWNDLTSATFTEINTNSYALAHFKAA